MSLLGHSMAPRPDFASPGCGERPGAQERCLWARLGPGPGGPGALSLMYNSIGTGRNHQKFEGQRGREEGNRMALANRAHFARGEKRIVLSGSGALALAMFRSSNLSWQIASLSYVCNPVNPVGFQVNIA